ncbi:hypothetical protein ACWOD8_08715 [Enterococcus plantarum]|nr:hypothetical protein [Enterococcus plantarum]
MNGLTASEKKLFLEFLDVELEKGGNRYTDVLLKVEAETRKEIENETQIS